jgi:xanthine/CO dehydrogenase XdhC/CoxF family maturation factor
VAGPAALAQRGISGERLSQLKAPAGLDLGAITPDEIAISAVACRARDKRGQF